MWAQGDTPWGLVLFDASMLQALQTQRAQPRWLVKLMKQLPVLLPQRRETSLVHSRH